MGAAASGRRGSRGWGRLGLGVAGGDDDGGGGGGRIDGESGGAGPLGGHAHFGVAGLVAGGEGELGGAGGGVLFQLHFEEEGDVAFVGFGVGVEVGVEGAFGLGLEGAEASDGGVGRELDFGGHRGRGGHGVQVPAFLEAACHADEHFTARRRGGRFHAELPGDVLILRKQPAGEKKQCEDCRLHAKSVICNDFSSWRHLYSFDACAAANFPTIFGALVRLHRWMKAAAAIEQMDDARISEAIRLEWARLRNFIRKRVADQGDAEDILQDVFYELIEAYRLMKPIEQVGAWLFRVARNRITDRFRKQRSEAVRELIAGGESGDAIRLVDLLPSPEAGPEAAYARSVLIEELEDALGELPEEQREVFIAHEIEGRSFKELAAESGCQRQHAAFAEAIRGAASAPQAAGYLRRIYGKVRTEK